MTLCVFRFLKAEGLKDVQVGGVTVYVWEYSSQLILIVSQQKPAIP